MAINFDDAIAGAPKAEDSYIDKAEKDAWAAEAVAFTIFEIDLEGPNDVHDGDQWVLSVARDDDGIRRRLPLGATPKRDVLLAQMKLNMGDAGVGPVSLEAKPIGGGKVFWQLVRARAAK